MNALSAHLDRGWDLIAKGEYTAAAKSARRVLSIDKRSPEGHTLLGACKSGLGDSEAALECFQRAIDLDPQFIDPLLYAAEINLWPLEDYETAIRLCEEALELAEEETPEFVDSLLLKADAELGARSETAARRTLSLLPSSDFAEGGQHLRAAQLFLDLGELDPAEEQLRKATARQDDLTDAWYTLGLIEERRGRMRHALEHWLKVRELDLAQPRPPWALDEEAFEKIAEQALGTLPERIRALLANVPIMVSDVPAPELVAEGHDPRMLGFFSGVPYPDKPLIGSPAPELDCIFLYQRNIERACHTKTELIEEIRTTLLHETGHFFGLSEAELDEIGLG